MTQRRPLETVLAELVSGLSVAGNDRQFEQAGIALRPSSMELDLPVEASVELRNGQLVVLADSPQTRLRTAFDRPTSRLSANIIIGDAG